MTSRLLLFAPGAGAPSTSPWMIRWAERLGELGRVLPFDYPYQLEGRRSPDRLPKLVAAHRAALDAALGPRGRGAVLVGKSMGSRVGCHLALDDERVKALVCLGYPLRGAKGALRDEVLLALRVPVLFVQGERDPLCPIDCLEEVRVRMGAPSTLFVVPGGNHSLSVGKRELAARGLTQDAVDEEALVAIRRFLQATVAGPPAHRAKGSRDARRTPG